MDSLIQDLRYAFRTLRRSPAFTIAAVLSLGLGIGANTAIFSVADALMFRKLAVREPDRLVSFEATARFPNLIRFPSFPYPGYRAISQIEGLFDNVAAIYHLDRSNIVIGNVVDPATVRVALVSGNYFSTFGVEAVAGRAFTPEDDRIPGGHPIAVISDRYWKERLSGTHDAIGRTVAINATTYTIVGVMPPRFQGDEIGQPVDLWIPMAMQSQVMTERPGLLANPSPPWLRIVARLRPGVSAEEVRAAVQTVYRRTIEDRVNLTPQMLAAERQSLVEVLPENRGTAVQRSRLGTPLLVLMTVVGLVLLIACTNVANLMLARSAVREREMGVRLAVGAERSRLVRQLLTESVALAVLSGVVGLVLANWGTATLAAMVASGLVPFDLDLRPDLRVVAFTVALSMLTGLLFGLAPALRSSSLTLSSGLRGGSDRMANRFRLHRSLLVFQVCVSVVLLIGAGLFVRTLRNLETQDVGFDRDRLVMVSIAPSQAGHQGAEVLSLLRDLEPRMASLSGVRAVSAASGGFLMGGGTASPVGVLGRPRGDNDVEQWLMVGAGFFRTIGMPLAGGREFGEHDDDSSPRVAVVNESLARFFFGDAQHALGHYITNGGKSAGTPDIQIVGVSRDAKHDTVELRALVSAANAPAAWDLRCEVREALIAFLQREYPHALPKQRAEVTVNESAGQTLERPTPLRTGVAAERAAERSRAP